MSFALPIQLLTHCQLLISTPTGDCRKKASFELKPLELEQPGVTRPLPTSIHVRAIETSEGTIFELSGNLNDPQTTSSSVEMSSPPEFNFPAPFDTELQSNFDVENETFRGFDADIDRWIHGLQVESQRTYPALPYATDFGENAAFAEPLDPSSSSQTGYGDDNGDTPSHSYTLPSEDQHNADVWRAAASAPQPEADEAENSTSTSPSEYSSQTASSSKKSGKGKRNGNPKKRQTQHRPRPFRCRHPGCERVFTSNYTRETHMLTHRPKQRQSYQCTIGCGALFSRKHDRFRHEVSQHGKPTPWTCTHCSQYFASEKMLSIHSASCNQPMQLNWKPQRIMG